MSCKIKHLLYSQNASINVGTLSWTIVYDCSSVILDLRQIKKWRNLVLKQPRERKFLKISFLQQDIWYFTNKMFFTISTKFHCERSQLYGAIRRCGFRRRTHQCNMPVAWLFTELSAMALATGTRFVFLDSVACNWSSSVYATSRMTLLRPELKRNGEKNTTTMHGSHVSFIRAAGKIPANTWHRGVGEKISFDSRQRRINNRINRESWNYCIREYCRRFYNKRNVMIN